MIRKAIVVLSAALLLLAVGYYAGTAQADPPSSANEYNYALASNGGSATASSSSGSGGQQGNGKPDKAIDGNMGTWWNSRRDLGWLAVQFADPSTVGVIHLHFALHAPPAFDLYLDLNGDGSYASEEEIRSVSGNVDLDWRWTFAEVPAWGMKVAFTG